MRIFTLLSVSVLMGLNGCKTTKEITKIEDSVEIEIPFSDKKFKTDNKCIRASQSGVSQNLSTAKKIAVLNAKTELAGNIKSIIKTVTEQYINQSEIDSQNDFKSQFEEISRFVSKQSIGGIKITDEKTLKGPKNYTTWVVIEVSKDELLLLISNKLSNKDLKSLEIDKKKFETIFNTEMNKYD